MNDINLGAHHKPAVKMGVGDDTSISGLNEEYCP